MRSIKTTLACLGLLLSACGADTASTTTTGAGPAPSTTVSDQPGTTSGASTTSTGADSTTSAPTGDAEFALTNITFGDGQMVVITNVGGATGSLVGHFLCQRPNYFRIPDLDLEPGQSLALSTGGASFTPPTDAITVEEVAQVGGLSPTGGEIGLYASADFANPAAILSYVEWGSDGHARAGTAAEAGIWEGFVPTTEEAAMLTAITTPPTSADHWDAS